MKIFTTVFAIVLLVSSTAFAVLVWSLYQDEPTRVFRSDGVITLSDESHATDHGQWPALILEDLPHWSQPQVYQVQVSGVRGSTNLIRVRVQGASSDQVQALANFMTSNIVNDLQLKDAEIDPATEPTSFTKPTLLFWLHITIPILSTAGACLLLFFGYNSPREKGSPVSIDV